MRFKGLVITGVLFGALGLHAQDTVHVVSHARATVVTNPSTGLACFPARVRFPSKDLQVRTLMLNVRLGCPDSMRCADWDYVDRVLVHRFGTPDTFEVARMLTPYGGQFARDWSFGWAADLTDLSSLMRDSAEVIYEHSGFEPNADRGWAVTLDFAFVKGPPAAEVLEVRRSYVGNFKYGHRDRSIEEDLVPRAFLAPPNATLLRLRINQTGHGMQDDGCGEFCGKMRYVVVDGDTVNARRLWKECGSNPLQPQAGTWIFDRANWCPGELNVPDVIDVPLVSAQGELLRKHTLDIDMERYVQDSSRAVENILAYTVMLAKPRAAQDVELEAILEPLAAQTGGAASPACSNARVRIRNQGRNVLRDLVIRYGTEGFPVRSFQWSGALPFGATAEVTLPGTIDARAGGGVFFAEVTRPNGRGDGWKGDDRAQVRFTAPDVLGGRVVAQLRTNKEPGHNALTVRDASGKDIVDHPLGSLRADTVYSDTLVLPAGCYTMQLSDTAGDGLEFWYNTAGGRGSLRLLDGEGRLVKDFASDCGNGVRYVFTVNGDAASPVDTVPAIGLFPTRTTGRTVLDLFANAARPVVVRVLDEQQQVVEEHRYGALKEAVLTYDLSYRPPQRYTVKVLFGEREVFSRRLRVVERLD